MSAEPDLLNLHIPDLRLALAHTSLGVWADVPHPVILSADFFEWYGKQLGFDLLALMVDDPDKDPTLSWGVRDMSRLLELADPWAIEIVLTSWPYPDKRQIDELCARLRKLMAVGPIAALENDLEWNWLACNLNRNDFSDMSEAGDYLFAWMSSVCSEQDARYEVTSHAYHPENFRFANVSSLAARILSQAYSVSKRKRKNPETGETEEIIIPFTHKHGPGRMQRFTFDRAMEIPQMRQAGEPELCVGLAAWAQRFTWLPSDDDENRRSLGLTIPVYAMLVALIATLPYAPPDIRWWSLKHIYGPKANSYAAVFLDLLRAPKE